MGRIRSANQQPAHDAGHHIPEDVEALLRNWGRWCAVRTGARRREHIMWKPARQAAACANAQEQGESVDVDQAWAVEKALCELAFDPRNRLLLIQHYVLGARQQATCRQLGLHLLAYEAELWRAAMSVRNRVQRRAA